MNAESNMDLKERDPNEIDLIDIVLQLWRSKWLISLFVLLGLALSGAFVVYSPQKWISTATITRPDNAQIASYTFAVGVLDGTPAFDVRDIETRLVNRFSSSFSALAESLRNQSRPESLTIAPSEKGQPLPLKLSYQASSPEAAQAQLTAYIEQTNTRIASELESNLRESLQQKVVALNSLLAAQEKIAQEQKDLRIEQIKEALKFAEAANIVHPQQRQGDNATQDTLFLLGSEALSAMVQRESMRPLVFNDDYFQTRQQLLAIQDLKSDETSISTYRYILEPTLPVHRDGPKTALVLILGVLLGGMIGGGVVLARNAVREYKASR
ncbi:LPS O-antigen chain length determinant protein WzzB [Klebsiella sp. BIGb0407]|uniref:LPS O-antigen chain length determinant protein WzzB n=1 Tax=Klebsiella sp. BIGb0407 TaxID=2940603 RepID=UPI002166E18D|nr:LPS O-antigen chain length determinant protein WzzB [Klebsiella sp. BIGb0407]MCS3430526.1 chain length determinant protein (polysaccharide antigen chain regulator) [Klebsiella sp. BIGb0407]